MRKRRALTLGGVAVVVILVAVPVGRWEERRANAAQARGATALLAAIGDPIASPLRDAHRLSWSADCLLYRNGEDPFAMELCFDAQGRLVEAIDRRSGSSRIWSFRPEPAASPLRIDPERLFAAFRAAGAFPESAAYPGSLPMRFSPSSPSIRGFGTAISGIGDDFSSGTLNGGRWRGALACLVYGASIRQDLDQFELCFDRDGNVVRAADLRFGAPNVSTLARDPGQPEYRVSTASLLDLLERVRLVPPEARLVDGRLPLPAGGG